MAVMGPVGGNNLAGVMLAIRQQAEMEKQRQAERRQQLAATVMGGVNTFSNLANTANAWTQPFLQRDSQAEQQGKRQDWATKERLGHEGFLTGEREAGQAFEGIGGGGHLAALERIKAQAEGMRERFDEKARSEASATMLPSIQGSLGKLVGEGVTSPETLQEAIEYTRRDPYSVNPIMMGVNQFQTADPSGELYGKQNIPKLFQKTGVGAIPDIEGLNKIIEGTPSDYRSSVEQELARRLSNVQGAEESPLWKSLQPSPEPKYQPGSMGGLTPWTPVQNERPDVQAWRAEEAKKAAALLLLKKMLGQQSAPVGPQLP